ncbi:MAG: DUF11 domain-containing protein, partial [Paracoccaceae bacterium]|nr:DUF11 domain-containing protein [Paracoccaceae bacterium]
LRQIVLQVTSVVADVAAATAGAQLTNTATLQAFDPNDPTTELTDPANPTQASETVEVVEPVLALDKSTTEAGPVDAGDVIPYQITIQNTGTGPAFDIVVEDLLQDAGLSLVSGSVVSSDGSTATEVANPDSTLGFTLTAPALDAGGTLTITYNAVVTNGFSFGLDVENTARVVSFDTSPLEPGDPGFVTERTTTSDPNDPADPLIDEEAVPTGSPDFDKSVFTTSVTETGASFFDPAAPDLTIGEIVVYRFQIDLPEGEADLTITDQLPLDGAFSFLGVFVTGTPTISGPQVASPITSFTDSNGDTFADRLVIDLGTVTNAADNVLDANDTLIVDALIRVEDDARNAEGDSFIDDATLDFGSGTENDDAVIDVVEPNIVLDKSVEDTDLFLGQTFNYTVVIENLATATAPAFDLVITDAIPAGIVLTGNLTLSDPSLGAVVDGDQPGDTAVEINVPILQPGESLTIVYEAEVQFTSPILEDLVNTAQVTGGSVPLVGNPPPEFPGPPGLADGPGRPISLQDSAIVVAIPAGAPEVDRTPNFSVIDDALFLPVVLIDPIYSGTTEYGAGLSIELFDELGGFVSSRYVLADAAGQWIAAFPLVQAGIAQDRGFDQFFEAGSIFHDPTGTLPEADTGELGLAADERVALIGTRLTDDVYRLRIEDTAGVNANPKGETFNTRLFYAPAMSHDLFAEPESIRIGEVFEGAAELTVQRLFDASVNPLASGLNRFNAEFLTVSATSAGSR